MKLDLTRPIVICRSAAPPEPLDPAATLGYACTLCAKPLQVGRTGVKQIRELRGQPVCNACGGAFTAELTAAMKTMKQPHPPVEIRINPLSITVPGNYYEGNDERRMAAFLRGIASRYRSLAEDEGYDEQTFHLEIAAGMVTVEVPALSECETRLAADFLSLVARVFDPSSGSTVATRTKRPAKRKAVSA